MKKLIGILFALAFFPQAAMAQCSGVFPANSVCGTTTSGPPRAVPSSGLPVNVANPTATIGPNAVNGVATTAMRSDAAPPLAGSVLNGVVSSKTTTTTATTNDCGYTLSLGGSAFYSITLNAASGYASNCRIEVYNADTTAGKTQIVSGLTSRILLPKQKITYVNNSSTWIVEDDPGRWRIPSATTFNVDPVNGSNTNDGLAAGTGRAFQTVSFAYSFVQTNVDGNGASVKIKVGTASPPITFTENLAGFGSLTGISGLSIEGDLATPANYIWSYGSGTGAFARDLVYLDIGGFKFTGSGVSLSSSQSGVIDYHDLDFAGSGFHLFADAGGQMTPTGNYTISSTAYTTHLYAQKGGAIGFPAITVNLAAATFTNFVQIEGGQIVLAGGLTFTGAGAAAGSTGNKFAVNGSGSNLFLNSVTLPGATGGSVSSGGSTRAPNSPGFPVAGISGGIPYFNSTTTVDSTASLVINGPLMGGGVGVGPYAITAGTTGKVLTGNTGTAPSFETLLTTITASGGLATSGTCTSMLMVNCGIALTAARQTATTVQKFLTGSGTYTTPTGAISLEVDMVGGGGGGAGSGTTPVAAVAGGDTCWNTTGAACTTPVFSAGGGALGGTAGAVGAGGTVTGSSTCNVLALTGGNGQAASGVTVAPGGMGGSSTLGGVGPGAAMGGGAGSGAKANSGSGGGGGASGGTVNSGGGGGAGATCRTIITSPAATYTYAVGAAGAAGTAGTGGSNGGAGSLGNIMVIERYNFLLDPANDNRPMWLNAVV